MVKVLYIVDTLKQRFGVTAVAMNYFRNIDRSNVKIDFLCYPDSEQQIVDEIKKLGGEVYFMPSLSITHFFSFIKIVKDFFSNHSYDIVHSHFNQLDSIIFPIAKRRGVKWCISHSHNTKYSDYRLRAFRNWLMCLPLKSVADTWGACSIKAGRFLYGKAFDSSSKSMVINNAINCEKYAYNLQVRVEMRKSLGIDNQMLLGNVGSLKLQKNQEFLMHLMAELTKKHPNEYKLAIAGDGDLKSHLMQLSSELGISEQVMFLGQRSDVEKLLQAFDIFLLPSLYEGLPVIGIEAQASGLPCLFSSEITGEVEVCNVKFLGIDTIGNWINEIEKLTFFDRKDVKELIKHGGYDIEEESLRLSNYYKKIVY